MLDAIKKKLGLTAPVVEAVAEPVEADTETSTVVLKIDASHLATELSVMRKEFELGIEVLTTEFEFAKEALTQMTANFEAAQAALNALTAEKAELAVKAEAAKFVERKEKVVMAIGTEKADGLMLATQGLDDAAFAAVVGALAGSVDAEAKAGLFTEVGVAGSPDTTNIVVESSVMKLINKKNNKTK